MLTQLFACQISKTTKQIRCLSKAIPAFPVSSSPNTYRERFQPEKGVAQQYQDPKQGLPVFNSPKSIFHKATLAGSAINLCFLSEHPKNCLYHTVTLAEVKAFDFPECKCHYFPPGLGLPQTGKSFFGTGDVAQTPPQRT